MRFSQLISCTLRIVLNPKDTLKTAGQQGLITHIDQWSELHMNRNLTSHAYDEQLAETIYTYLKQQGLALFLSLQAILDTK